MRTLTAASGLPAEEIEMKVALIQAFIPLGMQAVGETLEAEVTALASTWYCRTDGQAGDVHWRQQRGSVYLADQKLPIPMSRVRDRAANREVTLTTYEQLRHPRVVDAGLFRKILVASSAPSPPPAAEGGTARSRPRARTSSSTRITWPHSRQTGSRCRRRDSQPPVGARHTQLYSCKNFDRSWVRSVRAGPPKPTEHSRFDLSSFSGET